MISLRGTWTAVAILNQVKDVGVMHSLPDSIVNKMRAEHVSYATMCSKISLLSLTLDKLRKSSHPYERLCGRLLGMFGEKLVTSSALRQFLEFRSHVAHSLRVGRKYLKKTRSATK